MLINVISDSNVLQVLGWTITGLSSIIGIVLWMYIREKMKADQRRDLAINELAANQKEIAIVVQEFRNSEKKENDSIRDIVHEEIELSSANLKNAFVVENMGFQTKLIHELVDRFEKISEQIIKKIKT